MVEDVELVQVVLVQHQLQVLAVFLQVDGLQLPRLVVGAHVVVQGKVAEALEAQVRVGHGDEGASTGCEVWRVRVELYLRWDLALVDEKLNLFQMH